MTLQGALRVVLVPKDLSLICPPVCCPQLQAGLASSVCEVWFMALSTQRSQAEQSACCFLLLPKTSLAFHFTQVFLSLANPHRLVSVVQV